ncbi:SusC/RagA family TonB-linked outer membrane protein [Sphingobacterium luzhongxinii]|uniref:SusC/RagA family TonB-linked outer membrane protein n=1 Tax=Sphingobacterium luzhongxinii TaxID=2654181 RepID=UPI001969B22F|nr:SusC/RagA family TonB-linked outer membrane protein [Sphingobacterium sp. xlx-73]
MNNLSFGKGRNTLSGAPFPIIFRIMKITTALTLIFMTCAYGSGKAQKVSLSLRNAKLEDAFKEISKQTKYKFLYNDALVKEAKRVNIQIQQKSLDEALSRLLSGNQMVFKVIDETITVNVKGGNDVIPSNVVMEIQNKINGVVKSSEGTPLVGASISVKGSTVGTTTDSNGAFSIQVNNGQTLLVKYIGYISREIPVSNQSPLSITLIAENDEIEEVVVTGMGMRVDKRFFTGATSKITGEAAKINGLADPSRGLEGKVAGVTVSNVTGTFGTAPKIRVRGATSIYGSSKPLWVLDGVILEDIADVSADDLSSGDALTLISSAVAGLNANDIESFQVLKDGSATSLYGARAMAGVIVITTKKGSAGRSAISYMGEYTARATPSYSEFNILNSQEQMSVYQDMEARGYLGLAGVSNASSSGVFGKMFEKINKGELKNDWYTDRKETNAYLREAEYRNTDWFDLLYNRNLVQNHAVSLSSGTNKSQYYASASAMIDPGWTKKSAVDRYTGNLNANFNILDNLKFNLITNGSYRNQEAPGTLARGTDSYFGLVKRDFDINPYYFALNTSRTLDPNEFYVKNYAPFNILHELNNNYIDINVAEVKFQGQMNWKPIKDLDLGALVAIRYQTTEQQHHIKDMSNQAGAYRAGLEPLNTTIRDANPYLYKDPTDPYAEPISVLPEGGIYNQTQHKIMSKDFRFTAQYDKNFAEKHQVTLFGLASVNALDRNNTWFRGWGIQYEMGEIPFYNYELFKQGQEQNTQYYSMNNNRVREAAFAVNGIYSYDSRYVVNAGYRYEGSNKLGRARTARWMPTWSISGAWNMHNEKFFESINSVVSHLTLKSSYSLTGNRGPSFVSNALAVIQAYNPWRPNTGDGETGLEIASLENSELGNEEKHELNIGVSTGFLNNRINLEFDWFKRDNFNLIGIINTQGMGGEIAKFGNVAEMESNGLELALTAHVLQKENFKWTSNFIYTHTKNKVTRLKTQSDIISMVTGMGFAREGYDARSLFSVPFIGLNNEGLPQFINENGDQTVSGIYFQERDKLDFLKYSGTTDPTDLGSFGNTFTYKNFRLNVFLTYSYGNVVRLNPVFGVGYSDITALPKEFANRWTIAGDEAFTNIPAIPNAQQLVSDRDLPIAYSAYNYSTERIAKGDFIRMKDISLSYDFSKNMISRWKLNDLGLKFNVTNPFLIYADKKLNGQDPEFITSGGVSAPIPRQYTLTVRLGL